MRIIAKKTLEGFIHQHSNCASQLRTWYQIASKAEWASLDAVRQTFPSADAVGNKTVFNIKGNAYRLITAIHYNRQTIYIREFLTHAEYNKGDWKTR